MSRSKSARRLRRVLGAVDIGRIEDAIEEIGLFADATTVHEIEQRLHDQVALEVEAMLSLVEEFDALDVVELMRLREHPVSPVLALEPGFHGSSAALELVTAVLCTRNGRKPSPVPREDTRPHETIDELHDRAKRLIRLATYRAKSCEMLRGGDPLARLSAEYQGYLVGVRSLQYDSIQAAHETALFGSERVDGLLRDALGFSFSDFVAVNEAVVRLYGDTLTGIRDSTGSIFLAMSDGHEPTEEQTEFLQRSMVEMMFLPAERAAFSATDIAERCELDAELVSSVLDRFSVEFDPQVDAVDAVFDFLHARNPFGRRGLVRAGDEYLLVAAPIGGDSFRAVAEDALKPTAGWRKYDDARKNVSEALAAASLEQALGSPPLALGLHYYAPAADQGPKVLDRDCTDLTGVGKVVESDALFVIDDVAVCLEVKARSVAEPARRGDLARLKTEIKNIMGDGAHQARRLETLIRHSGGLWLANRTWLDLGQVREIHTVVAGLDYFGPLGVALGDLADTELLGEGRLPWIASTHDLDVISRVVDRPTEFLLYLRRRANSGVTKHYRGSDELDLFMLFMNGGLFVEEDPDDVHRRYPRTSPPTTAARNRYLKDSQPTLIGTFTDPLDAWMYAVEGTNPHPAEKPEFNVDPSAAELVDFLADGHKPGWLRAGADLLALSGEAQRRLTKNIKKITAQTRGDGRPHGLTQGFPGLAGYITFFAATVPEGGDPELEADKLFVYMRAKKHQVGSDRSLGLLVDHQGRIVKVMYMNDLPTDDPELDELGAEIGLQETWVRPQRPPSVSAKKRKRRAKRGRSE